MIYFKGTVITGHFKTTEYNMDGSTDCFMDADTLSFIHCIEEFRRWLGMPMHVHSWYRSYAVNKKVGGISTSNHLKGTAMDWHCKSPINTANFIKYVTKWNEICKANGRVPEAGIYSWGYHFGIQNSSQAVANGYRLFHWDSRTGTQINKPFRELNLL